MIHVLEPVTDDPDIALHWAEFPKERRDLALRELRRIAEANGLREADSVVVAGRAFEEVLRVLSEQDHQMVVMGQARRDSAFVKGLLGTTVERVARHSPVPVLVVREDHPAVTQQPQCLALATDLSEGSLAAFPWAEAVSRAYGASIELVSIQSMTVAIQALRSSKPTLTWYLTALKKEALTAVLLGACCGAVVGVIVWLWRGEGMAAVSIALSITLALVTACVTGLSVPSALHAARLDPKIAAGPITLALTDICTLLFYFGLASWLLGKG